jgi:hypothetical protein
MRQGVIAAINQSTYFTGKIHIWIRSLVSNRSQSLKAGRGDKFLKGYNLFHLILEIGLKEGGMTSSLGVLQPLSPDAGNSFCSKHLRTLAGKNYVCKTPD